MLLTCEGRFVTRVRPRSGPSAQSSDVPCMLTLHSTGRQHQLGWQRTGVREPGEGEVAVRVEAAGLNYRDVLVATGLVPAADPARPLGLECAGVVTTVGAGVPTLAPGDRVAVLAAGCLASHVTVRATQVIPIPAGLGFAEAATMPSVFLTVHHSLGHLARLAAGETLLIHGAAGGVGLAALQTPATSAPASSAPPAPRPNATCCTCSASNTYWTRGAWTSSNRSRISPAATASTSC